MRTIGRRVNPYLTHLPPCGRTLAMDETSEARERRERLAGMRAGEDVIPPDLRQALEKWDQGVRARAELLYGSEFPVPCSNPVCRHDDCALARVWERYR